jgi:hypothetical protein
MEESISLRGRLIKLIIEQFCNDNQWTNSDDVKSLIENELRKHLSFELQVSNPEHVNNLYSGTILFTDELGTKRGVNYTIIPTGTVVEKW